MKNGRIVDSPTCHLSPVTCHLEQRGRQLPSVRLGEGVLVAENAEDVEHRHPCVVLLRSLRTNDGEEMVESGFELAPGGECFGEVYARFLIGLIHRQLLLEFREILAAGGLQTGGRLQTVDL